VEKLLSSTGRWRGSMKHSIGSTGTKSSGM
jgi:hypothetical protein